MTPVTLRPRTCSLVQRTCLDLVDDRVTVGVAALRNTSFRNRFPRESLDVTSAAVVAPTAVDRFADLRDRVTGRVEQRSILEAHPVLPDDERPLVVRLDVEATTVPDERAGHFPTRYVALSAPRWE